MPKVQAVQLAATFATFTLEHKFLEITFFLFIWREVGDSDVATLSETFSVRSLRAAVETEEPDGVVVLGVVAPVRGHRHQEHQVLVA